MEPRSDCVAALMGRRWLLVPLAPIGAAYVYLAFTLPQSDVRIALRTAPVLPFAIWAVFLDSDRPLQASPTAVRVVGRSVLLLITLGFALLVLGVGLNWVFDPNRVS